MKKSTLLALVVVSSMATPLAWGAPGDPGTGLLGTSHDFTATGGGGLPYTPGTGVDADGNPLSDVGLCTYCHTPHHATSSRLLWNHTLSTNSYSWDVPSTTAGTTLPTIDDQTYNGATAKCLSCHDGTVAIGDVAWYYEQKQTLESATMATHAPDFVIADTTNASGAMSGNHPVAVPYPFGNAANSYNGITTGSAAYLDEWQSDPQTLGIRLFTDAGGGVINAGATAGSTGIECSSCHDPHNKKAVDDLFLRGTINGNDTNYICLKCHVK
jgi:hypothetical protein